MINILKINNFKTYVLKANWHYKTAKTLYHRRLRCSTSPQCDNHFVFTGVELSIKLIHRLSSSLLTQDTVHTAWSDVQTCSAEGTVFVPLRIAHKNNGSLFNSTSHCFQQWISFSCTTHTVLWLNFSRPILLKHQNSNSFCKNAYC